MSPQVRYNVGMSSTWQYDAVEMTGRPASAVDVLVRSRTADGWVHLATAAHPPCQGGGTWVYFKREALALVAA
jgi:hypothetical protein